MNVTDFLRQYEYADRTVRRLEREYEEQRIMIDSVKSTSDNDGMPHGTGIHKPVEDRAVKLADKLKELSDARLKAIEVRQAVFDFVETIPGVEGDALYKRYVLLMQWEEIAAELSYSTSGIYKLRNRAITLAGEMLNGHEQ